MDARMLFCRIACSARPPGRDNLSLSSRSVHSCFLFLFVFPLLRTEFADLYCWAQIYRKGTIDLSFIFAWFEISSKHCILVHFASYPCLIYLFKYFPTIHCSYVRCMFTCLAFHWFSSAVVFSENIMKLQQIRTSMCILIFWISVFFYLPYFA